jgi:branched-chain amino acid transport system substrate-binding protein
MGRTSQEKIKGGLNQGKGGYLGDVFLLAMSWGISVPQLNAQNTVQIGALFPFSGAWARLCNDAFRGGEVAAILKNEQGEIWGKKMESVKGDAVDPKAAQTEAERFLLAYESY